MGYIPAYNSQTHHPESPVSEAIYLVAQFFVHEASQGYYLHHHVTNYQYP